jgi:DNA repair protein RecN (Recombination protein N)
LIQFLFSANPGENMGLFAEIASGGEISRIALAFKGLSSKANEAGCLIFDEIDSGLGGQAARQVGLKLSRIAETRQVIVITHLATIACLADQHFRVDKVIKENKTYTKVLELIKLEDRQKEIARLLSGDPDNPETLILARTLLEDTMKIKRQKEESIVK